MTRLPSEIIGYNLGGRKEAHLEESFIGNCIVVVQFDLPKLTEEQAVKGAAPTAPIYRGLAAKGLIRKDYLNGGAAPVASTFGRRAPWPRLGSPKIVSST